MVGVSVWEKVWLKNSLSQLERGRRGRGRGGSVSKFNDPRGGRGRVCETDMARVRVGQEMAGQNYCVVDGCLLSLCLCRKCSLKSRMEVQLHIFFTFTLNANRSTASHWQRYSLLHPLGCATAKVAQSSIWDLWWTKWHWVRFLPKYFRFPLSVSFNQWSMFIFNNHHCYII